MEKKIRALLRKHVCACGIMPEGGLIIDLIAIGLYRELLQGWCQQQH